ncbi:MAG: SDR family NAD(P)-dependent oxidoreductase, partial [Rhodospirillaceae bacterium]|nr:SDR family NAD(P)-dependent oxidoreductase [Rhodospirillaceae bacterium]
MKLDLEGKVALVTGGARDVGREIALAFAAEGATVAVNYNRSANAAGSVVGEIVESGGKAKAYQADIADFKSVQAMTDAIVGDFGRIDVLVNNAGYVEPRRFLETGPEEWKRQIDVGLYGVIHCCSAAGAHMVEQGGGRIVNLTGDSARIGEKFLSITASSRGGVLTLTKSLAKEFGPSGVTVN